MPDEIYLTRKEVCQYLASINCPVAMQTLANMAANNNAGGGPPFVTTGWRTIRYPKSDLDRWAAKRMRSPK